MTDTDENIHLFPLLLFCLCQILGQFFVIPHTDYSITVTIKINKVDQGEVDDNHGGQN